MPKHPLPEINIGLSPLHQIDAETMRLAESFAIPRNKIKSRRYHEVALAYETNNNTRYYIYGIFILDIMPCLADGRIKDPRNQRPYWEIEYLFTGGGLDAQIECDYIRPDGSLDQSPFPISEPPIIIPSLGLSVPTVFFEQANK